MWKIVYSDIEPATVDSSISDSTVYLRRNIKRVTINDDVSYEVWQYEELQLSHAEYAQMRIAELEEENTNLQLALTELYEKVI